ncbi:PH domain-containing protein [uncultured Flavobacterium sp.]|uniref:PH domain-containing protein n=1 Tax=uncultured Flavobacterium sp. TaxID=165435 RepID=UPI0030C8B8E4
MKIYKSKVDWWLTAIIIVVFAYPFIEGVVTRQYTLSIVMLAVLALIAFLFSKIKYEINGEILKVWWIKIEINSIRKIYATNNPLSSPALSLDRIAIVYNTYDEVLISPKDKKEFIEELLRINPCIQVEVQF